MDTTVPAPVPVAKPEQVKAPVGLRLIAAMKIVKGFAMAGLALGVFGLVHKDLEAMARHFVQVFRISPENHYVELLLEKVGVVEPAELRKLGILTAFDASIQLMEGLGLWFGAWWAEYLVVISTGLFIPEEAMGTIDKFSGLRLTILILNLAMFIYVAQLVFKRHMARQRAKKAAAAKTHAEEHPSLGI
jgi:uncharacterized membrane protein (DUF2068 family)